MKQNLKSLNSFRRLAMITALAVYFLILVGGIVRSTGSGMGCPDWPKCFGSWVPPTSVNQLPSNYQEIYLEKRINKNDRFVASLERLGFSNKAEEIRNDKSILIEEEFNATKTWIEYVNRLIGAIIGLLILAVFIRSIALYGVDKWITILSFINLVLLLFQAWIGSIVVSTNLLPWMITVHMVLALLIVCLLLYVFYRALKVNYVPKYTMKNASKVYSLLLVGFILMIPQIVLGTQVREAIDHVAFEFGNLFRGQWINNLGIEFLIHRSYSLALLLIHAVLLYWIYKYTVRGSKIYWLTKLLFGVIVLEILSGVGMAYFAIPAFLQPIHLLFGALIIGVQFLLLLFIGNQKVKSDSIPS
ncbi:MAG: COX15/CtaA family protein [Nitritalea sp.]